MLMRTVGYYHVVTGGDFVNVHHVDICHNRPDCRMRLDALGKTWEVRRWRPLLKCAHKAVTYAVRETERLQRGEQDAVVADSLVGDVAELVLGFRFDRKEPT